jgi:serine/threonine-protein kinase
MVDTADGTNIEVLSLENRQRKIVARGGGFGRYLPSGHLAYTYENKLLAVPFDLRTLAVTGTAQPVLDDVTTMPGGPAEFDFSLTGTFVYISGKGEPPRAMFWLDASGKTQALHASPAFYGTPSFSPDGKRLAYGMGDVTSMDIWVQDLDRGSAVRLTSLPGMNWSPVWMPDSGSIVFASTRHPDAGIYWMRADGSGTAQRLIEAADYILPSGVSPDGKWLAMESGNPFAMREISIARIEGAPDHPVLGKAEPLVTASGFVLPVFSPDGHWVAYSSRETGTPEVYVRPFPAPGRKWRVSIGGGEFPVWSRDRRELFFLGPDRRIMAVDYMAKADSFMPGKPRLWTGKQILLAPGGGPRPPYALAPDGKRFAVVLYPDGTAEQRRTIQLTFLLNFFDELRRRVPAGGK